MKSIDFRLALNFSLKYKKIKRRIYREPSLLSCNCIFQYLVARLILFSKSKKCLPLKKYLWQCVSSTIYFLRYISQCFYTNIILVNKEYSDGIEHRFKSCRKKLEMKKIRFKIFNKEDNWSSYSYCTVLWFRLVKHGKWFSLILINFVMWCHLFQEIAWSDL